MIFAEELEKAINQYYEGTTAFLVDIKVRPTNRISVFIDGDQGITIEDCKTLTRFIESKFDRTREDYELTVSSAGADRPMKNPRQFPKHIGRELVVTTTSGTTISGKLIAASANVIELEHKPLKKEKQKPNTLIPVIQIREANVLLSFK